VTENKGHSLPLVSVITPSLNQGKFIEGTIRSVLEQSYPNLDYIVMDGGSTDGTLGILRKYEGKLTWISEKDRGQTDAVNKGFKRAKGDIFGWLNADDPYLPGAVQEAVDEFLRDPNVMLVYGDANDVDDAGAFIQRYPTEPYDFERFAFRCIICQPAAFMRRELVEKVGYLNADLQCSMDLEFWIRCGLAQKKNPQWKFVYVPRLWALNRLHSESKTFVLRLKQMRVNADLAKRYYGFTPLNWAYGIEEVSDARYDGLFRKRPLGMLFLSKVLMRWIWMNRASPGHVVRSIAHFVASPRSSLNALQQRANLRPPPPSVSTSP
jgi:glycosyltransferase involved in cell wall biosynthesis